MLHFLELWKRERERIGIERDMEAKPFALYGERCPNTTQFFCFDGVSECVGGTDNRCDCGVYPKVHKFR